MLFTDESKFNLHDSDGRVYVWRRPGEKFDANCTVTTYKSGDKGFMVWGAIGWEGVGHLRFCKENVAAKYYVEILTDVLPETIGMLGMEEGFQFMQDNASGHKAKITTAFFESNAIPTIKHFRVYYPLAISLSVSMLYTTVSSLSCPPITQPMPSNHSPHCLSQLSANAQSPC